MKPFLYPMARAVEKSSDSAAQRFQLFLQKCADSPELFLPVFQIHAADSRKPFLSSALSEFRLYVIGLQNLRRQLSHRPEIPNRLFLTLSVLYLDINMLFIFFQNILLLLIFQNLQIAAQFFQKCLFTHMPCPPLKIC